MNEQEFKFFDELIYWNFTDAYKYMYKNKFDKIYFDKLNLLIKLYDIFPKDIYNIVIKYCKIITIRIYQVCMRCVVCGSNTLRFSN